MGSDWGSELLEDGCATMSLGITGSRSARVVPRCRNEVVAAFCTRPWPMSRNAVEVMAEPIGDALPIYGRLKDISESVPLKRRIRSDQRRRGLARPVSEEPETGLSDA